LFFEIQEELKVTVAKLFLFSSPIRTVSVIFNCAALLASGAWFLCRLFFHKPKGSWVFQALGKEHLVIRFNGIGLVGGGKSRISFHETTFRLLRFFSFKPTKV